MGPPKLEHCSMEELFKKYLNLKFKSKIEQMDILAVNSKYAKYILENEQAGFCLFEYGFLFTSIKMK